jgi:hypothetical protein
VWFGGVLTVSCRQFEELVERERERVGNQKTLHHSQSKQEEDGEKKTKKFDKSPS